uniref:Uncharacterized protein n=1 Tax=Ixodes ricinus TaxID=34613 RepID=A0A6B0UUG0_IXORI
MSAPYLQRLGRGASAVIAVTSARLSLVGLVYSSSFDVCARFDRFRLSVHSDTGWLERGDAAVRGGGSVCFEISSSIFGRGPDRDFPHLASFFLATQLFSCSAPLSVFLFYFFFNSRLIVRLITAGPRRPFSSPFRDKANRCEDAQ